jgi:hypothetical protein
MIIAPTRQAAMLAIARLHGEQRYRGTLLSANASPERQPGFIRAENQ